MYRHTKSIFVHRPVPPPVWTINVSAIDPDDYSDMPSVQDCTDSNAPFFFDTPYCFATTTDDEIHSLALHNTSKYAASDHVYSFTSEPTEFGTDNCATHHICSLLNLFVNMRPAPKVGVTGVAGSTMASGIGTIMFTITDDDGIKHKITLEDVIYLPESAKNLISTSKWSSDKHDNCGILSRGKFSIFMWDNDNNKKHIVHPPDCQIPLMPVNEADDAFVLFNETHAAHFTDNSLLMPDGVYPQAYTSETSATQRNNDSDQQSDNFPSPGFADKIIPTGSTAWHSNKDRRRIAIIQKHISGPGPLSYSIRPLNSKQCITVPATELTAIRPEPADIPNTHEDVDCQLMTETLSAEELAQIWTGDSDNTSSPDEKLALYWHHRLRHAPLTCLHRLATRGVLPKSIIRVTKLPLCAACAFATAHRRSWRTKSKDIHSIRQPHHDAPGRGTSCDHMVSH